MALEDEQVVRWDFRDARPEDAEILARAAQNTARTGAGASNIIGFAGHQRQIEQMVIALRGGAPISVDGCSHLLWWDKVYQHRDYFDACAMLYEHLPLMGGVIAWLKRRLA